MVATMSKLLHISRKTLHKYIKFSVKIDENDETSCCALICRESYKERMEDGIKSMIFLFQNSWTSFKIIFTNTLNTPTGPGGKLYDLSILVWFLRHPQYYRW